MDAFIAFSGHHKLASGALPQLVRQLKEGLDANDGASLLIFDASGRTVDLDLRGSTEEALARLPVEASEAPARTGPGRPRLGVVPREVTLLPRHWDWLASQPGGASVVLRKLVEAASKASRAKDQARQSQEACHRFMTTMAGDLPGYEAAIRALFADRFDEVRVSIAGWPVDVRNHVDSMLLSAQQDAYEARED